ncbi:MAG: hypothetical protein IAE79_25540 [Anaerolinea sp.]|nr:hypothetical protein [Anaerolinea sp.]
MILINEIVQLQTLLRSVEPYPARTCPVPEMVLGASFFPGGQGLWYESSQAEIPVFPIGGVMIMGQDYYTFQGYEETLAHSRAGDANPDKGSKTWHHLLHFLDSVEITPQRCFFTNLFMGLRENGKPMGKFPGARDAGFVERCLDFFEMQVRVQQPKLILALGNIVPHYIARRADKLSLWRNCRKWADFDKSSPVVHQVIFQGMPEHQCSVVALTHPSMRPANVWRRWYQDKQGDEAEICMVKEGLAAVS